MQNLFMVLNGLLDDGIIYNSNLMSGRSPPLYYTLTLIVMQGHQTKSNLEPYKNRRLD